MNFRTFDRYALFTPEMLSSHMELIRDVQRFQMERSISDFNFINYLYGIFDGYLYPELLSRGMLYPADIYERVLDTYRTIDEWIENN